MANKLNNKKLNFQIKFNLFFMNAKSINPSLERVGDLLLDVCLKSFFLALF